MEEIGIDIKVGEKLISFEHSYSHKKLYFTVHLCEFLSGKPRPLASQKLLWIDQVDFLSFLFLLLIQKLFLHYLNILVLKKKNYD